MQLPANIHLISLDQNWQHQRPYPPLGFTPFHEAALGNGDSFGLYWPIGREASEPIVVETWHDEWRIAPQFSSLAAFLRSLALAQDEYVDTPALADDPASPLAAYLAAKAAIAQQHLAQAISLLETALAILPEYTDALSLLHGLYVRTGRNEEALQLALRALVAPPSFGGPPLKALQWLRSQPMPDAGRIDPIWRICGQMSFSFGGRKENGDYPLLAAAIESYLEQGELIAASTLMQTYAELMSAETVSFQERYGFDQAAFIARQINVSAQLAQGGRDAASLWAAGAT